MRVAFTLSNSLIMLIIKETKQKNQAILILQSIIIDIPPKWAVLSFWSWDPDD